MGADVSDLPAEPRQEDWGTFEASMMYLNYMPGRPGLRSETGDKEDWHHRLIE